MPAGPARFGVDRWWPLMVYRPWAVALLAIPRSALHRRPAAHAWCVVLFFSIMAVVLCICGAPKTLTGVSAVVLPVSAALAVFR
ncbi:hypothetical protein AB0D34_36130 [Streptomyces sp. NPDC048420]|uniref:hypothetical protein n=1 Tax=Streptomyces sp. NPDC048420 TaxID=3155755 RepID=UPI00341D187E